ncbi:MAG: succinate dehydrogenase assembly factor 2 [Betaproteobacteria bacterium]
MIFTTAPHAQRSTLEELELRRLRWRSRRGLLENDLIIERFLRAHGAGLKRCELDAFARLLELADNDLLDLLLARREPAEGLASGEVNALLERLRHC